MTQEVVWVHLQNLCIKFSNSQLNFHYVFIVSFLGTFKATLIALSTPMPSASRILSIAAIFSASEVVRYSSCSKSHAVFISCNRCVEGIRRVCARSYYLATTMCRVLSIVLWRLRCFVYLFGSHFANWFVSFCLEKYVFLYQMKSKC